MILRVPCLSGDGLVQASPVKPKPGAAVVVPDDTVEGLLGLCVGARPVGLPCVDNSVKPVKASFPGQVLPLVAFEEENTGVSSSSVEQVVNVADGSGGADASNTQLTIADKPAPKTPPAERNEQDFADEVSQLTADYQKALKAAKTGAP